MVIKIENAKRSYATWMIVLRVGVTAAFFFWFYNIWNNTSNLEQKLNNVMSQYSAIDDLQIEFKNESQEWKDVLLRSHDKESLNTNWGKFEKQYEKVASTAQAVILKNDIRAVNERLQSFVSEHKENHAKYLQGIDIFVKNGFNPRLADSLVNGIDRPLFDSLEAADTVLQFEKNNINEDITAKSRKQIEQSIFSLVFLVLFAVWMPRK